MATPTIPTEATDATLSELEQIAEAHDGVLYPEYVVDFAKNPATALHHKFDWDDTVAARKHRLHQARQIIRVSVRVLGDTPHVTRAFVSLSTDRSERGGYRRTVDVMTSDEQRETMLADAMAELVTFRRKYSHLKELAPLFETMELLDSATA